MPNISPEAIKDLVSYIEKKKCDIATLASDLHRDEIENENVVKVSVKEKLSLNDNNNNDLEKKGLKLLKNKKSNFYKIKRLKKFGDLILEKNLNELKRIIL